MTVFANDSLCNIHCTVYQHAWYDLTTSSSAQQCAQSRSRAGEILLCVRSPLPRCNCKIDNSKIDTKSSVRAKQPKVNRNMNIEIKAIQQPKKRKDQKVTYNPCPSLRKHTRAPPLPVNLAAIPNSPARRTICKFFAPTTASP